MRQNTTPAWPRTETTLISRRHQPRSRLSCLRSSNQIDGRWRVTYWLPSVELIGPVLIWFADIIVACWRTCKASVIPSIFPGMVSHIKLNWEKGVGGVRDRDREIYPYFKWIEVPGAVQVLPTYWLCTCWVSVWVHSHIISLSEVGIFKVHAWKCMRAQTRTRFIFPWERVLGRDVDRHIKSKWK